MRHQPIHPLSRSLCRCAAPLLAVGLLVVARSSRADDVVNLQPAGQASRVTFRGVILDYTGTTLTLRTGVGAGIKTYPAAEVVSIQTEYEPEQRRGEELYKARQYLEAEAQFAAALEAEDRGWVRRELLAWQARSALQRMDLHTAAQRFLPLYEGDPTTPHLGLIPLVWDEAAVPLPTLAEQRSFRASAQSPAGRLILASWQLRTNGQTDPAAEKELRDLANGADIRVQRLAQAQLWRLRTLSGAVTPTELKRWEILTEDLPSNMRGGAYYLIGVEAARQQMPLPAVAAWLWLPLVYDEQPALAAHAQWRAIEALTAFGDRAAATRLARELPERFPQTPAASRAREWLKTPPSPTGTP